MIIFVVLGADIDINILYYIISYFMEDLYMCNSKVSVGELPRGYAYGRCYFETPCGWCIRLNKQCYFNADVEQALPCCGSTEIRETDKAQLNEEATAGAVLEVPHSSKHKFTESVYKSFRHEVCCRCKELSCSRSEAEICACSKFVDYFEI